MERRKITPIARALVGWYVANARDLPWRRTPDPYAIWISEIMLQQTQVKTVIPYFERWMTALPTIRDFAEERPGRVLKLWEGLGYYSRVRNAQSAARLIMSQHAGRFPSEFEGVLALPGVGRYTAGAICSIAFNQVTPILDGNVIRVLTRIFGVAGDPRGKEVNTKLWELATSLVSTQDIEPASLNQALMELGALVCAARQPRCIECPVRQYCIARRTGRIDLFPAVARKGPATERRFIALVVRDGERFLVRRRKAGVVNGGLWEFPNFEIPVEAKHPLDLVDLFEVTDGRAFFRVRHSITRYRILLEAFHARLPEAVEARNGSRAEARRAQSKNPAGNDQPLNVSAHGTWKTIPELGRLAFSSAHRKLLKAVGAIASHASPKTRPTDA